MINIALSVPIMSGVSGSVRQEKVYTGQIKHNNLSTIDWFVRRVRHNLNSPIHARARVSISNIKNNIVFLLKTFKKAGQAGQSAKGVDLKNVFMSCLDSFCRTLAGQAGQINLMGPSSPTSKKGYSHLVFCAVWVKFFFRNFGKLFDIRQLVVFFRVGK